jgi:hypothetical protein
MREDLRRRARVGIRFLDVPAEQMELGFTKTLQAPTQIPRSSTARLASPLLFVGMQAGFVRVRESGITRENSEQLTSEMGRLLTFPNSLASLP